ncbi:TlpA family protein disulfide reductase [Pedobacter aquae]|uniref:TlpA family protein disulfide reductase n=1 Tax=Pedobacter aquae TaxID=2605747 RepID=A0A5C0VGF6_9SPHI|nr:TlpA disulfide reductase family protein [Pedobacter aquae]QEK50350.1 TlpA family protein disulfide reductase [Pedobacter aquae]
MNDKHRIGYILPFFRRHNTIKLLVLLLVVVVFSKKAKAQQALQVGDSIPKTLWDLKLQTFNHPQGKSNISLQDYKSKLIILDFWSTWCGACVQAIPELKQLQKQFSDRLLILPITADSPEQLNKAKAKNAKLAALDLFTVLDKQQLKAYFPHQLVPHLVWISPEGRYLGATLLEYANAHTIHQILSGRSVQWYQKKDEDAFNPKQLSLHQYLKIDSSQYVLPFIDGQSASSGMVLEADSTLRYYIINASMAQLYAIATQMQGIPYEEKRRKIKLQDTLRYQYHQAAGYQQEWLRKYGISYERRLPKGTSIATRNALLLADLNRHFRLKGEIVAQETPVWLLKQSSTTTAATLKEGLSLASWIAALNKNPAFPWVLNETTLSAKTFLPRPEGQQSLAALQVLLQPLGLYLEPATRTLPTFILEENHHQNHLNTLSKP